MAKTLGFYVDTDREEARHVAVEVTFAGRDLGYRIALCDGQDAVLHLADPDATVEEAELLVTVGGDGTLLRGARVAYPFDIPLLGVNTGRLGFLTELDGDGQTRKQLREMLRNGISIDERVALEATFPSGTTGDGQRVIALNDVVVRKGEASRIVPFGLELDGEHIASLPADGVVVATPTGSTAYFLSAGGPIVAPSVDVFGIAALLPHTLFARPLIVGASATIGITLDSEIVHANLEADGETVSDLAPGDRVTIRRAPKPFRFARVAPERYFTRLEQKLRWGVPIRGFSR
ncbi:MAG: NAD(+)/NADH kinase [Candidatus Eremiobacteraeota bacterium]|nr:NAD(+)/NADH kinase [Candidatus Eremiobacteraeota bacterium]MBV8354739.1 NAD(+)/NADH kinase [Candidatus Eremiobacteraeota bacterium]